MARCFYCQVEGSLEGAFHVLPLSGGRKRIVCPPCWNQRYVRHYRTLLLTYLCLAVAGALSAGSEPSFGWFLVNAMSFHFFVMVGTVFHELGHAVVARAVGMRVFAVVVGMGPSLVKFRFRRVIFDLRALPFGGFTFCLHKGPRSSRPKEMMVNFAGFGANLLLAAIVSWGAPEGTLAIWSMDRQWEPLTMLFWAQIVPFVLGLRPKSVTTPAGHVPNDARNFLNSLRSPHASTVSQAIYCYAYECNDCIEERKFQEALEWCNRGLGEYPDDPTLLTARGATLLQMNRGLEGRADLTKALAAAELDPGLSCLLHNNIAYADILIEDPKLLDEADRFSKEALEILPWNASFMGTRGAVLLALGRIEEAIELLERAMSLHEGRSSKAICACFLAMAKKKRGNLDRALDHLAKARAFDPDCQLLQRAAAA